MPPIHGCHILPVLGVWICLLPCQAEPDFERDIAPILESACLFCHNDHDLKGDLSLASRDALLGYEDALLPGDPDASLLIQEISGDSPAMPKKADPLAPEEVALLRQWIGDGAPWPKNRTLAYNPKRDLDWWSLKPIPPAAEPQGVHPVDAFVDAQLQERDLSPMGSADSLTLIRRATYDLTGLPPSPEEVAAFVQKPDWDSLVDRLLASPAFGEKFGQHWLDVARYAETHGYDKDKPRENAWPYRDYVIRSFNADKPFARFVQEQVAGDVLFPGNPESIAALGFLAAGPWDFIGHWEVGEGKLDGRIAKHLDRDEMVSATFNVFQSTTVQCAQCHHHKFDPIRMEDYYRLHAVFAAVDRADRVYAGLPPKVQARKETVVSRINALKEEQDQLNTELKQLVVAKASGIDRRIAELKEKFGTGTGLLPQYGYHSHISKNPNEEKWVQVDLGKAHNVTEVRIMPAFDNYAGIGAGFGFPPRYRVQVSNDPAFTANVRTLLDATNQDQPNPKKQTLRINGDGRPFRYLRVTATKLALRSNDYIFALGEIEAVNEGGAENFARNATVTAKDSIEQGVRWGRANLVDGIFFRELNNPAAAKELATLQAKRSAIEKATRPPGTDQRLAKISTELAALEKERKAFPSGKLVYAAATHFPRGGRFTAREGKPRSIHLLNRGDLRSPGESMTPGVPPLWTGVEPVFFESTDWKEGQARAELARYLTRRDNPLLWRSIANRLWQWTMGAPLVETANDFGQGGAQPTHPELLDYLAARLRDDPDQSLKSIIRLIVTSETYRRAATHNEANAAIDAGNAYLWRAHRRRLTAEEFRDSLLLMSGVLDRKMGGPSFKDFVIEKPQHSPHYQYHLHDPNNPASHRRSIYRFVVRSQPQPMLTTLDCADPSLSVPQRDESTTALQALTQWNHRFVEAMSRKFAVRLRQEAPHDPDAKVHWACHQVLSRNPSPEEQVILREHLQAHGEESLSRVLFNLNAFVYVD